MGDSRHGGRRDAGLLPAESSAEPDDDLRERNEKVLHTRIPHSLDREIKKRARNLGLSVSTVVRNVLLHTFDLVEDIVTDSTNVALSLAGEGSRPSSRGNRHRGSNPGAESEAEVLGWQQVVLNLNAVCNRCNAILEKGATASIGLRDAPGRRIILCTKCVGAVTPASGGSPRSR